MSKPWEANWGKTRDNLKIGTGGQGIVYRMTRISDGVVSALKVYHRTKSDDTPKEAMTRRNRSAHEVFALRRLDGRGVPKVYEDNVEHAHQGERTFAAFEFVEGPDLAKWLERN